MADDMEGMLLEHCAATPPEEVAGRDLPRFGDAFLAYERHVGLLGRPFLRPVPAPRWSFAEAAKRDPDARFRVWRTGPAYATDDVIVERAGDTAGAAGDPAAVPLASAIAAAESAVAESLAAARAEVETLVDACRLAMTQEIDAKIKALWSAA